AAERSRRSERERRGQLPLRPARAQQLAPLVQADDVRIEVGLNRIEKDIDLLGRGFPAWRVIDHPEHYAGLRCLVLDGGVDHIGRGAFIGIDPVHSSPSAAYHSAVRRMPVSTSTRGW